MSAPFPAFPPRDATASERSTRLRNLLASKWLREPLLHFVLIGGLLFAVDALLIGRADDPRTIYVDAKIDSEARKVFTDARGQAPSEEELYALRKVWLDNEVLYREGLALQVDKGDPAIRERVIFKSLSVIDAGLKLPPVDDGVLREWFERNRAKYDEPTRYDFEEAVLAGETSEAALREFATSLNAGAPGDARASLRVFKGRPLANLQQSYGPDFARTLEASPIGEWRVIPGNGGVHVMRLQAITPARQVTFESLGGMVMQDWVDATMAEQRTAAVRALAGKYTIKVEAPVK